MLALKCSIQAVLCRNNYIESSSQMQPQNHSMWYSECSITKATIPFFKCEFIKCIMRNCTESESKHQYAIKCTFYNKYMGFYTYVLRYEREVLAMSPICHHCKENCCCYCIICRKWASGGASSRHHYLRSLPVIWLLNANFMLFPQNEHTIALQKPKLFIATFSRCWCWLAIF